MKTAILGNTGIEASRFAFGGIVVSGTPQGEANDIIAQSYDRGVTYYDVAPTYGNAQEILGPAIAPYRDRIALACKTTRRDRQGAMQELEESLRLLKTDHFDIYQLHGLTDMEEIDQALSPGGALEAFVEAKAQGKILHIGFSSHGDEAALRLMDSFAFESVLFPINWGLMLKYGMGIKVLEAAAQKGMACLAMKALAFGPKEPRDDGYEKCWYRPIIDDRPLADLALRFALSSGAQLAISPGDVRLLRLGLDIMEKYAGDPPPLSAEELETLKGHTDMLQGSMFERG